MFKNYKKYKKEIIIENGEKILKITFCTGDMGYFSSKENGNEICHRTIGPAIDYNNSYNDSYNERYQEWWYRGKFIPVKSQEEFEKYLKMMVFM